MKSMDNESYSTNGSKAMLLTNKQTPATVSRPPKTPQATATAGGIFPRLSPIERSPHMAAEARRSNRIGVPTEALTPPSESHREPTPRARHSAEVA
jgi:hypothetical protein